MPRLVSSSSTFVCLALLTLLMWPTLPPAEALRYDDKLNDELLQLRELIVNGLEQRRRQTEQLSMARKADGGGASLDDVVAGAKAFATVLAAGESPVTPEAVTPSSGRGGNGTATGGSALWFAKMLHLMPLAAWIALLVVVILILVGILVLIIVCCFRGKDRDKLRPLRNHGDGPPQTLLYNDLDILGKEQPPYGIINFALEYDVPTYNLIVTASSCIALPMDLKDIDPYVVIKVKPDFLDTKHQGSSSSSVKPERSKVVKANVNPAFNYTRTFRIRDKRQLKKTVVIFEVYDWDIGTRHRMIARRALNLAKLGENLDEILGRKVEYSRNLQPGINEAPTGPGDICLALCYSTQDRHLWVNIIECKGVFLQKLDQPDFETLPNTYVKLVLTMAGSNKRMNRSTDTIKESRNPYYNAQFVFKIEPIQMQVASLRVMLMHRTETLRIKRVVGALTLSLNGEKDSLALRHWHEAVISHDRPIARWHTLITLEAERKLESMKAAAELKRQIEIAEEEQHQKAVAEGELSEP